MSQPVSKKPAFSRLFVGYGFRLRLRGFQLWDLHADLRRREVHIATGNGLSLEALADQILDVELVVDERKDDVAKAHGHHRNDELDHAIFHVAAKQCREATEKEGCPRKTDWSFLHRARIRVFENDRCVCHLFLHVPV